MAADRCFALTDHDYLALSLAIAEWYQLVQEGGVAFSPTNRSPKTLLLSENSAYETSHFTVVFLQPRSFTHNMWLDDPNQYGSAAIKDNVVVL